MVECWDEFIEEVNNTTKKNTNMIQPYLAKKSKKVKQAESEDDGWGETPTFRKPKAQNLTDKKYDNNGNKENLADSWGELETSPRNGLNDLTI